MKNAHLSSMLLMSLLLAAAGCGSGGSGEHKIVAAPARTAVTVPTTKEEKIAEIQKSAMPKEMKASAIARVNSGP